LNYNQAVNFLYEREKFGWVLGLSSMQDALHELGNPQNGPNYVHIAGTNGKGSVAVMTESVLRNAGYSTGLYTSPHLVHVRERIQINGEMISEVDFARLMSHIAPVVQKYTCTFFETLTILAFVYFQEHHIEYVCLEVGLGGRLDATNIVSPKVTAVTSIGFDHTEHLGSTYADIAAEKFGIVKSHIPCVIGMLPDKAVGVGESICKAKHAELYKADQPAIIVQETDCGSRIQLESCSIPLTVPFPGNQQIQNLKIVLTIFKVLDLQIPEQILEAGLRKSKWPARFQLVSDEPLVILDVAHNPASIKALIKTIKKFYKNRNTTCLFAVLQDKAYLEISRMLVDAGFRLIPLHLQESRALPAHQLYESLVTLKADVLPPMQIKDSVEYVYKQRQRKQLFIYTGSHYTIGKVLGEIKNLTN